MRLRYATFDDSVMRFFKVVNRLINEPFDSGFGVSHRADATNERGHVPIVQFERGEPRRIANVRVQRELDHG
jgi:hypothetical protein